MPTGYTGYRPTPNAPYGSNQYSTVDYDPNWWVNPPSGVGYNYGYPTDMGYANWWDARNRDPRMEQDIRSGIDYAREQQGRYQRAGDQAYSSTGQIDPLTGQYRFDPGTYQPGQTYSGADQENIIREGQFQAGMTTPEQFARWGLTDDEISQITGNPYAGAEYFNSNAGNIYRDQDFTEQRGFDRLGESHRNIRGDIGTYQGATQGLLDSGGQRIRGTLDQGETGVRGTYNDPRLGVSDDFLQNYQFGDADIADLETQAGRAVGARYQGAINDMEMQAAQADVTNPLGVAAMKQRYLRDAAAEAGDAQVGARVAGRGLQLATTKGREDTRLGAEQNRAGMALEGELNLSGRRTAAEQRMLDQGLATEADLARMRMEGEQYLGTTALNENRALGEMRQLNNRYIGSEGSRWAAAGEEAASGRARDIAGNRQQTQRDVDTARYGQNFQTQSELGNRYQSVADQRLAFERERRAYLSGQQGMYYQGGLTGQGQQVGAYGARMGAQNQAGANYSRDYRTAEELALARQNSPTRLERGLAAGLGVFTGILNGYNNIFNPGKRSALAKDVEGYTNPTTMNNPAGTKPQITQGQTGGGGGGDYYSNLAPKSRSIGISPQYTSRLGNVNTSGGWAGPAGGGGTYSTMEYRPTESGGQPTRPRQRQSQSQSRQYSFAA